MPQSSSYLKSDASPYSNAVSTATTQPTSSIFSSSSSTTVTTSIASDQYTELLKNEQKITDHNARLASKFEAQKSNFEISKSLNVPSSTAANDQNSEEDSKSELEQEKPTSTPVSVVPVSFIAGGRPPFPAGQGPRARPPLRPMFMFGGQMAPPVRFRGMSPPRPRFPPGARAGAGVGDIRMSPPPRNMAFFRYYCNLQNTPHSCTFTIVEYSEMFNCAACKVQTQISYQIVEFFIQGTVLTNDYCFQSV